MRKLAAFLAMFCAAACSAAAPEPYVGEPIEVGVKACLDYLDPSLDVQKVTEQLKETSWAPLASQPEQIDGRKSLGFRHDHLQLTYLHWEKNLSGDLMEQPYISCSISGRSNHEDEAQDLVLKANGVAGFRKIGLPGTPDHTFAATNEGNLALGQIRFVERDELFYFEAKFSPKIWAD